MSDFRFTYPNREERHQYLAEGVFVFNGVTESDSKTTTAPYIPGPITHRASQNFADAIYDEIHRGYGFTPMLGAGFSVSAGIPIIWQLQIYLQRCICVALGVEDDALAKEDTRQLWNPRTDRWPPLIDRRRSKQPDWVELMKIRLDQELRKAKEDRGGNPSIYQEAYGAMAEWRSALVFISRLVFDRPRYRTSTGFNGYKDEELRPRLVQPSQSVIDAGWREWMRDKRPSLNHRLLATLSGLLRIDVILTTNFDDLIERAFEESRNPLQVFDVRLIDGLPEFEIVSRGRSLVKMHGSTRSLRADYSLDGEPSAEDKRLFAEYLAGQKLDDDSSRTPEQYLPETKKHLLVFGVAASEARTMAFLTNALRKLPNLKIFWVCYTDKDVQAVISYAKTLQANDKRGPDGKARFYTLRHTDAGLLFLHIYQLIRKTIPPSNAVYPSSTQLSIPPLPRPNINREKELDGFRDQLIGHIRSHNLCVATAAMDVPGVTTVCAEIFRQLELPYVCMWIEMNDIHSIDELFEIIQETAYSKLGQRDWTPLYAAEDHRPRRLEVKRLAEASNKSYLIFINAREKPGANRDFNDTRQNAWLDDSTNLKQLDVLLDDLENASQGAFKVVLLLRDPRSPLFTSIHRFVGNKFVLKGIAREETSLTVEKVMKWVEDDLDHTKLPRLHFLHALTLMQRSRHLAITWARCTGNMEDRYWSDLLDCQKPYWLDKLEEEGLLRRKDGGFIWMHSNVREALRTRFLIRSKASFDCKDRANIHQSIALWYLKQFDAVGTPPAIFEAVDHLCFSAAHLMVGAAKDECKNARELLIEARQRVETARQLLQDHWFIIHTQGYPRASSRRLQYISDFWLRPQWMTPTGSKPERKVYECLEGLLAKLPDEHRRGVKLIRSLTVSIAKLQCITVELGLMIAREIGEDRKAYEYMQVLSYRLGRPLKETDNEILTRHRETARNGKLTPCHVRVYRILSAGLDSAPSDKRRRRDEWIRWWLWCGLLGIASRSYEEAEHSLYRAVEAMTVDFFTPFNRLSEITSSAWMILASCLKCDFRPGINEGRASDPYKTYLQGIYAIQEAANLLILRANSEMRLESLKSYRPRWDDESVRSYRALCASSAEHLKAAEAVALRGLVLIEDIQDSGIDRADHDHQLMTHKSRLLQLVGLASRYDVTRKEHSRHAMSMLGDATAALSEADPLFARAEYAIIDLRRAEVRLREAASVKLFAVYPFETWTYDRLIGSSIHTPVEGNAYHGTSRHGTAKSQVSVVRELKQEWSKLGDGPIWLSMLAKLDASVQGISDQQGENYCRGLEIALQSGEVAETEKKTGSRAWSETAQLQAESERERIKLAAIQVGCSEEIIRLEDSLLPPKIPPLREDLREITSRATDALRFLDRAEPILRERRRNVSWTTCYFELRLRAISLILWASIVQERSPIPYLGLEAAMRKIETEPDQLLNDAVRMIRVDSYRLAMIVLTYASCARALQIRLALDQAAVRLPERLAQMHRNLYEAISHLEAVIERRNSTPFEGPNDQECFAKAAKRSAVNDVVQNVVQEALLRSKDVLSGLEPPTGTPIN